MMDFSSVTAIAIPEGTVKKIRDAAGNTIWQKAEDTNTVTVLLENSIQQSYQKVIVNGATLTQAGQSASVAPGTIIQLQGQFGAWEVIDPDSGTTAQVCNFADTQTPADYKVQYGIQIRFDSNGLLVIKKLN
jgi:hypothetical protein